MVNKILMPALLPTMEEGTLAKWLVKEGDEITLGDLLAEIETDNATMKLEAVDEGIIGEILVPEGSEGVRVNTAIAVLVGLPAPSTTPDSSAAKADVSEDLPTLPKGQLALRQISSNISQRAAEQRIHEGVLTDVAFLARSSDYTLQLNVGAFNEILDEKLNDFQARADSFQDQHFTDKRLFAWCAAVRRLTGHFNIANKHFLDNTGSFIDNEAYIEKCTSLISSGLLEVERRFGGNLETVVDWMHRYSDQDIAARRLLAQAMNYLGRYAYKFRFLEAYEDNILPLLRGRVDVLTALTGAAMLPIASPKSRVLSEMEKNADRLAEFFDPTNPENYTCLSDDFLNYTPRVKNALSATVRSLINLSRHEDVLLICSRMNLDASTLVEHRLIALFMPSLLLRSQNLESIESALRSALAGKPHFDLQILLAELLVRMGRPDEAIPILMEMTSDDIKSYSHLSAIARLSESLLPASDQKKLLTHAEKAVEKLTARPIWLGDENTVSRVADVERMQREQGVFDDYAKAIKLLLDKSELTPGSSEDLSSGDRIVLFSMIEDRVSPVVLVPLMPILQRSGARFYNLIDDGMTNEVVRPWPFSPRLTLNFEALQSPGNEKNKLLNDWIVSPQDREISCNGVNYYEGFYERVSRILKVYNVDWELPYSKHFLDMWLRQSDRAIAALDKAGIVLRERGAKATLISLQSQFAPYFVLKMYADHHSDLFEHVTISSSYENWATNVSGQPVSSLTLLNNTLFPQPSAPAFGRRDHFENWFATEFPKSRGSFLEVTNRMTEIRRSGELSQKAQELLDLIQTEKAVHEPEMLETAEKGSLDKRPVKVFCVLGKIPYDLAVPYQGGPAHQDIKDWINHTVEVFSDQKDLLLIKPHPHELNYAISHKPNETFLDLISNKNLPDNIIILPYQGISLQDLFPVVDHFICWNGSSIPEIGSQGLSIMACDDWGGNNYPVNVKLPRDREHYEAMLRGAAEITMHREFQARCAAYISYMVEAPFAISNPYVGRSATNTDFNRAWVNWDNFTPQKLRALNNRADLINMMLLGKKTKASGF